MMYLQWVVWFCNCIFNQIVMITFLISIISNSYERVMSSRKSLTYEYKCDLNLEVQIFKDCFPIFFPKNAFNSVILLHAKEGQADDADAWGGIIDATKVLVRQVTRSLFGEQEKHNEKLDEIAQSQMAAGQFLQKMEDEGNTMLKHEFQQAGSLIKNLARQMQAMDVNQICQGHEHDHGAASQYDGGDDELDQLSRGSDADGDIDDDGLDTMPGVREEEGLRTI